MANELITMNREELKALVAQLPANKRAAFSKAAQAACRHLKDSRKNYAKAFEIAEAMVENWWRLGQEIPRICPHGGDRTKLPKGRLLTLEQIGINFRQSARCQELATKSKPELDEMIAATYDEEKYKLPSFTALAKQTKEAGVADPPEGEYSVIVLDPPWPMEKIERDVAKDQTGFDYPTMTEEQLAAMTIPAADNCHVFVWTTCKFLPMSLRLIQAWGFKYVCPFVWHKPGGFQPFGLPQYNAEFCIYARKGSPKFTETKKFPICFKAPRGKHSEKPGEFYDLLRRVTSEPRIDMFNRRPISGFDLWGDEA